MNNSLTIRFAKHEEAEAIYSMIKESFLDYMKYTNNTGIAPALKDTVEDVQKVVDEQKVLVLLDDDEPVGSLRCNIDGKYAYIGRVCILPKYRQRGYGTLLMHKAEDFCVKNGVKCLALHTTAHNVPLIRFYMNVGYIVHSATTDRGYIRVLLIKPLNGIDIKNLPSFLMDK